MDFKVYLLEDILGKKVSFEKKMYTIIDEIDDLNVWVFESFDNEAPEDTVELAEVMLVDKTSQLEFLEA